MSHSYGLSVLAIPALTLGTSLVVPGGNQLPLAAAAAAGATIFPTVPSYLRALLRPSIPAPWPATLRLVISAGEPLSATVATRSEAVYGRRPHVFYGASETGGICYDRDGTAACRGSVGTLLPGVEVEVIASDAADGDTFVVRSAAVAQLTTPTPDPERLAGGRFVSDDLARVVGNELSLQGRRSSWINVRGRKVSPCEVERVLSELEGVEEAVVVGEPCDGDGEAIKAYIVSPGRAHNYMDVLNWCRDRLAPYKVPRALAFVDELPRTERGKLDRQALGRL